MLPGNFLNNLFGYKNRHEMRKGGILPNLKKEQEKKGELEPGVQTEVDTGTKSEYASSTWTNQQILVDSLQNPIDAENQKYKKYLQTKLFSYTQLEKIQKISEEKSEVSSELKEVVNTLLREVYYFVINQFEINQKNKNEIIDRINDLVFKVNKLLDFKNDKSLSADSFEEFEMPSKPEITYAVYDVKKDRIIRGLTQAQILSKKYSSKNKFPLFEFRVVDNAGGFDSILAAKYISTKKDDSMAIGNKGEGAKVNQVAMSRIPGVVVKIASIYNRHDGGQTLWTRSPFVKKDKMYHRGRTISGDFNLPTGTVNTIRFANTAKPHLDALRLAKSLDPRETDINQIALGFGETESHKYPFDPSVLPGISLENKEHQYVQGLVVGRGKQGFIFSYDFPDRKVLPGRDRSSLDKEKAEASVVEFWKKAMECGDIELLSELFNRVFIDEKREFKSDSCEGKYLKENLYKINHCDLQGWVQKWPEMFGLKKDEPNFLWPYRVGPDLERDQIKKACNIVDFKNYFLENEQYDDLVDLIQRFCPEYKLLSRREAEQLTKRQIDSEQITNWTKQEEKRNEQIILEADKVKREILNVMQKLRGDLYRVILDVTFYLAQSTSEETDSKLEVFVRRPSVIKILVPKGVKLPFSPEIKNSIRKNTTIALLSLSSAEWQSQSNYISQKVDTSVESDGARRLAQWLANDWIQVMSDRDEVDIPSHVYTNIHRQMGEQALGKMASLERTEQEEEVLKLRQELYSGTLTPQRQQNMFYLLEKRIKKFREDGGYKHLYWECINSVVVTGNTIHYFKGTERGAKIVAVSQEKEGLKKIGTWQGYDAYEVRTSIDGDRSFVWVDVPLEDGSLLIDKRSGSKYFISDKQVWNQDGKNVYKQTNYPYRFEHGLKIDAGGVFAPSLDSLEDKSLQPKISFRNEEDLKVKFGSPLESPITLEYIDSTWNKQERLVLDIWSNHDDADKDGVKERFLVERKGKRVWVTEKQNEKDRVGLQDNEKILGYEVADGGLGYSPVGINDMGHTLKRNPLLTGKNGEGLKLVAASALKQGLQLKYASTGINENGELVAWSADAGTTTTEFTKDGKKEIANSLVFNLSEYKDLGYLDGNTSFTRVILPQKEEAGNHKNWESWLAVIDPRKKDKFGSGGTRRIVLGPITSENKEKDRRVRVGPVEVLLDRPGEIYENGKLITNKQQGNRRYNFGWNFPSISSTRERDKFDEELAMSYIKIFMTNLEDESVIEEILKQNIDDSSRQESDISIASNELGKYKNQRSFPIIKRVASRLYPGKILFNYASLEKLGESAKGNLKHIPESDRIYVGNTMMPNSDYANFMPNMHSYLSAFDDVPDRIAVQETDLEPVRAQVISQLNTWEKFLQMISENPDEKTYLDFILAPKKITTDNLIEKLGSFRNEINSGSQADVFVGHDDNKWHGLASVGIGINIEILAPGKEVNLAKTIDHEIIHKITGLPDYDSTFLLLLFHIATFKYYGKRKWPGLR